MLVSKKFKSDIIFFWVEDHICIDNTSRINSIVEEMQKNKVDNLLYTFFHNGQYLNLLKSVEHKKLDNLSVFEFNLLNHDLLKTYFENKNIKPYYILSCSSFYSFKLFKKNLDIMFNKHKYNKLLPFDFEVNFFEKEILAFNYGILHNELFVSIDDDHGQEGYCLISRKQYPSRVSKKELDVIRKDKIKIFSKNFLRKIIEKIFSLFK